MNRRLPATLVLSAAILSTACGARDDAPPDADPPRATDGDPAAGAGTAGAGGVRIVLTEGPGVGTHERSGETICVHNAGSWIVGFSEYGDLETQGVLEGIGADGGSTQQVQLTIALGDVMAEDDPGTMVMLAPGGATGLNGSVTRDGAGAEIQVEGTTHYGQQVTAQFRCSTVQT